MTQAENDGSTPRKRRRGQKCLAAADALEIVRLSATGLSQSQIGVAIGVSQSAVSAILRGETWGSVTGIKLKPHKVAETIEERFWKYVDKAGPTPGHMPHLGSCWVWTGAVCGTQKRPGYGYLTCGSRTDGTRHNLKAHRYAYERFVGPIPDGMQVHHACDNRRCCRPEHLRVGTAAENSADMVAKMRHPVGERRATAKLKAAQVAEIRRRLGAGERPAHIAADYGVNHITIQDIARGRTWAHLLDGLSAMATMPNRKANPKLTYEQVAEIRRRLATGHRQVDIAADFGITADHVSLIKRGRVWTDAA
jgi:uncharacterized protein (DUF433 family)